MPADHPLRRIRPMVDGALKALSPCFDEMYSKAGRPSIAPEKLLKALLLQVLCTIRSERLLEGEIAEKFFAHVLSQARSADLLSSL